MSDVIQSTNMHDATVQECALIYRVEHESDQDLWKAVLGDVRRTGEMKSPYRIDRAHHALQTATRALREGASIDLIVAAIVHDIGDVICPRGHEAFAAAILKPYVSAEAEWVVAHHAEFIGYYYWDKLGLGRNANLRDRHREHPWFELACRFGEWDQLSFDPDYPTLEFEDFEPAMCEVFSRKPYNATLAHAHSLPMGNSR